ncbi:MAG: hypothetical protein K2N73_18000 [Lachnospiraceae bacterium]|nr:hypothetical protein [Lachnospiraceae bacterium]
MTEEQLKNLLKHLHMMQAQCLLLEEYSTICKELKTISQNNKGIQTKIIKDTINILNPYEKFVIEMHLIYHHTWMETTKMFSEQYGKNCERSERTLKRIQSRGLKKMLNFINNSSLKDCFDEM